MSLPIPARDHNSWSWSSVYLTCPYPDRVEHYFLNNIGKQVINKELLDNLVSLLMSGN